MCASGADGKQRPAHSRDIPPTDTDLPQVWIFQPAVKHYRLPVWDLLVEQARGRYEITVFGPLDIEPDQIANRPYLYSLPLHRRLFLGREIVRWGGAARMIRRGRPEVIVLTATISFLSSWTLPRVARRIGAAAIGWSKVNSRAGRTKRIERRLKRIFFRRFDRFLCYGQASLEELVALGFPRDRAVVAQNTIDTRRLFNEWDAVRARGEGLRQQFGMTGKRIILCIGRMVPQKRHADLISAWNDLRQLDPNLVLVMVGAGPLYEGLVTAAEELDANRILLTGRVAEGDDYAWIATSDVVVIPGAVGLALNQAMACGKPIVIANEPGADAELLEDGKTGWRYPRGDIHALTATLRAALTDTALAQQRGAAARECIFARATLQRMVATLNTSFTEAIALSATRREKLPAPK